MDNWKLSRPISSAAWEEMNWQEFESLSFEYLRARYGSVWHVERTAEVGPDGGRDMELSTTVAEHAYRIWVECKHHAASLGLDTIGKSFLVVIANGVNELILLSSSPITEPAKSCFFRVAHANRLRVSFRDGEDLDRCLLEYPDIVRRHFRGIPETTNSPAEALHVVPLVSQYADAFAFGVKESATLFEEQFFVHVRLKNRSAMTATIHRVDLPSYPGAVEITLDAMSPRPPFLLHPLEDTVVSFFGRVLVPEVTVDLGHISIEYERASGARLQEATPVPTLHLEALKIPPLVGERLQTFLTADLGDIAFAIEQSNARLLDVRGASGVGKSRLLDEVRGRLRSRGFRALHYDAMALRDGVLRNLLADLTNLSVTKGRMTLGVRQLPDVLRGRGCDPEFADALSQFLARRVDLSAEFFALTETVKHLLQRPFHPGPLVVLIDNVQELSPTALDLLVDVAEFLRTNEAMTLFVLATNTEVIDHTMVRAVAEFHERLDAFDRRFRIRYDVQALRTPDARVLLYHLLHGLPEAAAREAGVAAEEPVLDLLIGKAGNRPLELVVTVDWMASEGVIERRRTLDWHVPSFARFADFVRTVPSTSAEIIRRRLDAIRDHVAPTAWSRMRCLLRTLLAFRGRLPETFVSADAGALDVAQILVQRSILRFDTEGVQPGYAAFHDNFYRFFEATPEFRVSQDEATAVLAWLARLDPQTREEFLLVEVLNANRAGRPTAEVLTIAERFIDSADDAQHGSDILEVGATFLAQLAPRSLGREELVHFLRLKESYADALLHQARMTEALAAFDDLHGYIREGSTVSAPERDAFYHHYVNAQLHTAHFGSALRVLDLWQRCAPSSPWYHFLQHDRRAGAYDAFGDAAGALETLTRALDIARGAQDAFAEGIAHYDVGYVHIHVTHERESVIGAFTRSLEVDASGTQGAPWRVIELHQQRAIIRLLQGDSEKALEHVDDALWLSKRNHLVIYEVKLANLAAACHIARGRHDAAREVLLRGRSIALLYRNERAYWRAMANLGALVSIASGPEAAVGELAAVEARLRGWFAGEHAFSMEIPILANYLAVCADTGRAAEVERILRDWPDPRLKAWRRVVSKQPFRDRRSAIGIVSHAGVGLLIS